VLTYKKYRASDATMTFPQYIDVPVELQDDDFSCVPVCIKMVLEYIKQRNPDSNLPLKSLQELSSAMGTDELGTPLDGVQGLNSILNKTLPSIEFEGKIRCTLAEIEEDLEMEKPVFAWLKMPFPHSIVVTGLDKQTLTIYYNDPLKGKNKIEMGKFMSAWEALDRVLIKVKIGEKLQRTMIDFIDDKTEGVR